MRASVSGNGQLRARAFINLLLAGYQFHAGQIHAGMVVVEFMLADEGPGDGGVAVVQGSREMLSRLAVPVPVSLTSKASLLYCRAAEHGA